MLAKQTCTLRHLRPRTTVEKLHHLRRTIPISLGKPYLSLCFWETPDVLLRISPGGSLQESLPFSCLRNWRYLRHGLILVSIYQLWLGLGCDLWTGNDEIPPFTWLFLWPGNWIFGGRWSSFFRWAVYSQTSDFWRMTGSLPSGTLSSWPVFAGVEGQEQPNSRPFLTLCKVGCQLQMFINVYHFKYNQKLKIRLAVWRLLFSTGRNW